MAFEVIRHTFPGIAATSFPAYTPVTFASGVDRGVKPVATANQQPLGITGQAVASAAGMGVLVRDVNCYSKAVAAGSIGIGAEVGVASFTGSQFLLGPVAGASGAAVWSVGQSVSQADAAGELFTFHVNPRQLSGLV